MTKMLFTIQILDGVGDWIYFRRIFEAYSQLDETDVYGLIFVPANNKTVLQRILQWSKHQDMSRVCLAIDVQMVKKTPRNQLEKIKTFLRLSPNSARLQEQLERYQKNDQHVDWLRENFTQYIMDDHVDHFIDHKKSFKLDILLQISVPFENDGASTLESIIANALSSLKPARSICLHEIYPETRVASSQSSYHLDDFEHHFYGLGSSGVGVMSQEVYDLSIHELLFTMIFSQGSSEPITKPALPDILIAYRHDRSFNLAYIQTPAHMLVYMVMTILVSKEKSGWDFYINSQYLNDDILVKMLVNLGLIQGAEDVALISPLSGMDRLQAKVRIFNGFDLDDAQYQSLAQLSDTCRGGSGDHSIMDVLISDQIPFISSKKPFKIEVLHDLIGMLDQKDHVLILYLNKLHEMCSNFSYVGERYIATLCELASQLANFAIDDEFNSSRQHLAAKIIDKCISPNHILQSLVGKSCEREYKASGLKR